MEGFETGHGDRVTVLHVNYDGSRILTASIDHKIKVWERDHKTGERTLLDTFTAHDADIRDAKFLHPTLGSYIGTIAADLKFHLWTEEHSQAPNSGRRFKRIATIASGPRIPFSSMDFKIVEHVYTYLALIDRQGLLSIYEPSSPDELKDWTLLDQFNVTYPQQSQPPSRGEETSFKVRFDHNPTPLAYINSLSNDESQLGLVVTSLNDIKIYHSLNNANTDTDTSSGGGPSHRITFHETFRTTTYQTLVRDVAWAPFNVRGTDRIAAACKDGSIRIFELGVLHNPESSTNAKPSTSSATPTASLSTTNVRGAQGRQVPAQTQSSLTSAITSGSNAGNYNNNNTGGRNQNNASNTNNNTNTTGTSQPFTSSSSNTNTTPSSKGLSRNPNPNLFPWKYQLVSPPTVLSNVHGDAWSVTWDGQGQVLMSSGADGAVKIWRKAISNAAFMPGGNNNSGGANNGNSNNGNLSGSMMSGEVKDNTTTNGMGGWKLFAEQSVEFGDEGEDKDKDEEDE